MARWYSRPLPQLAAALLALVLLLAALPASFAQDDSRYFSETGHTLRGMFRVFWEANGAMGAFGYPITEEYTAPNGLTVQWFERARFERVTLNGQPQVALGNLGSESIGDRIFPKVPPIQSTADRRYIAETQHIIQYGFKEIWETRGDVRIFGYPISEEIDEVLDDGEWHTVQYFEKARFEYWPNFPPGERVLLSHLGRKLVPVERTAPGVPGAPAQPTAAPAPAPTLPPSVNATVSPESGPPGTSFAFSASGFEPGELVGIWLTAPNQATFGADFQASADSAGSIAGANIAITTDASYSPGVWSFNAQGVRSDRQAIGYFLISDVLAPGDPGQLGVAVHDQLPTQGQAFIAPVAAPAGTTFIMVGGGFTVGEEVGAWFTAADGASTPIDASMVDVSGGAVQVAIDTSGLPDGVYNAVIQGKSSGVIAAAGFKVTVAYVAGPGTPRPNSVNGESTPPEGGPGTTFQIRGRGLTPNEELELWVTDPTGAYILSPGVDLADASGRIGYSPPADLTAPSDAIPGVYGIHWRGMSSGVRVDVYFTLTGAAREVAGAGGWVTKAFDRR